MTSPLYRGLVFVFALAIIGIGTQAYAAPMLPGDGLPAITNFGGKALSGGQVIFTGDTVNCPPGTVITLGGIDEVEGVTAVVDQNGHFAVVVEIPNGTTGLVGAVAQPPQGLPSAVVFFFLPR